MMMPKDLVIPWFSSPRDWRRVRGAATDARQLGESYAHWLTRFTALEADLTAKGHEVKRVPIEPDEFFAFCSTQRVPLDELARHRFVLAKAGLSPNETDRYVASGPPRRVGVGWLREDQWERLRALDLGMFDESYEEWLDAVMSEWTKLAASRAEVVRIDVDLDKVIQWCEAESRAVDVDAFRDYIKDRLRTVDDQVPCA